MSDDQFIFQDEEEFWTYIQNSLRCENIHVQDLVNNGFTKFVKCVSDHFNIHINDDQQLYRCGLYLINSELYESNKQFCIAKSLSILNIEGDLIPIKFKYLLSYLLLLDTKNDSSILNILQDYQGFKIIYQNVYEIFQKLALIEDDNNSNINDGLIKLWKKSATIQLDILFQLCKYLSIPLDDLQIIDEFFINYIFESLIVAYSEQDIFNASKFKIILAINEQLMINDNGNNINSKQKLRNIVFEIIKTHHQTSRNFNECLLVYFNREEDHCLQIMISKLLYLILMDKSTADLFYNNDLNVLIDVLIRELTDLSEDQEFIRNTYLRVLYPLLQTEQIVNSQYKREKLKSLLLYLSGQESTFWKLSDQTKRLALKCMSIPWLFQDTINNSNNNGEKLESILNSSNTSLESISQSSLNSISKKNPPPLPLPRKSYSR
ncbi:hypothetical protein WICMUC_000082 [Wickerhamomyces mucosus]|uniref:SPIN90/Ldb17 leucine-rich domain-containing protein n=1 Tax=Wickerhamomyces mucosus TaxID=1378264 RepID=A0A9P8Q180_9ASCO|nr:hypothetical protein WICMUC_000082 [Wickerhamomyces mucosus]